MKVEYLLLYSVLASVGLAQNRQQGQQPQQQQQGPRQQGQFPPQGPQGQQQGQRQQGQFPPQGPQGQQQGPRQQGQPPQGQQQGQRPPQGQQGPQGQRPPQNNQPPPQQQGGPPGQACGKTLPSCPARTHCQKIDALCFDLSFQGNGCIGQCVADRPGAAPAQTPKNEKPKALGFLKCPDSAAAKCARNTVCVPSMRTEGAVMCVNPEDDCGQARFGGNLGALSYKACPAGKVCVADPKDGCPGGVCNSTNGICIIP